MCVIIKALDVATAILSDLTDSNEDEITERFTREANLAAMNITAHYFVVDLDTLKRGLSLIGYFNLNKLILSSYNLEPTMTMADVFEKIIGSKKKLSITIGTRFLSINKAVFGFMQTVFKTKCSVFTAGNLSKNNTTKTIADEVFGHLEHNHLGRQIEIEADNHLSVNCFIRISSIELENSPEAAAAIVDMGLDLNTVKQLIVDTEAHEDKEIINENNKRTRPSSSEHFSENMLPANKRMKYNCQIVDKVIKLRKDNKLPYLVNSQASRITSAKIQRIPLAEQSLNSNNLQKQSIGSTFSDNSSANNYVNTLNNSQINPTTSNNLSLFSNNNNISVENTESGQRNSNSTAIGNESINNFFIQNMNDDSNHNDSEIPSGQSSSNSNVQIGLNERSNNQNKTHELEPNDTNNNQMQDNNENQPDVSNLNSNQLLPPQTCANSNNATQINSTNSKAKSKKTPLVNFYMKDDGNYYGMVNGIEVKCSKYGIPLGRSKKDTDKSTQQPIKATATHQMVRRNSHSESEPGTSTSSDKTSEPANVQHRNVKAICSKNFNPNSNTSQDPQSSNSQVNGWDL